MSNESRPKHPAVDWMPEFKPMNVVKRHSLAMHPGDAWHLAHWYEKPREDPSVPEVYTYTDLLSYEPGEEVAFHTSTTARKWTLQVYRDGNVPALVHEAKDLDGAFHATPARAYRVASRCVFEDGASFVQHHFFVVRPIDPAPKGRFLLILPTSTWLAYNDWGGANSYDGIDGDGADQFSPTLSTERPWTRGLVWLPPGAPSPLHPIKRSASAVPRRCRAQG